MTRSIERETDVFDVRAPWHNLGREPGAARNGGRGSRARAPSHMRSQNRHGRWSCFVPKLARPARYTSPYQREVMTISEVVVRKLRLEIAVLAGGFGPATRDGAAYGETAPPQLFPPPDNVVTLHPAMHWRRGQQSPVRAKPAPRGASMASSSGRPPGGRRDSIHRQNTG